MSENETCLTKQKIINCALELFAKKGFVETSVRELAERVGIKAASLYNHFPTKNAILQYILDDYLFYNKLKLSKKNIELNLTKNPTPEGIMSCLVTSFPDDKKDYYLKVISVILQEQHRNSVLGNFVIKEIIQKNEKNIKKIINFLIEKKILRDDTNIDFWAKLSSSLFYSFSNRMLLGIGDMSPDFNGMRMEEMLKCLFETMFEVSKT